MMYYRRTTGTYHNITDTAEVDGIVRQLGTMTKSERTAAGYDDLVVEEYPHNLVQTHIVTEVREGPTVRYNAVLRPLDQVKEIKKSLVATYRYQVEVGGCTLLNGVRIASDDRAKMLLNGAYIRAKDGDPTATRKFKTPEGFVDISNAQIIIMAEAIADHVQACFDAEAAHCAAIDTIKEDEAEPLKALLAVVEYDYTTKWPGR